MDDNAFAGGVFYLVRGVFGYEKDISGRGDKTSIHYFKLADAADAVGNRGIRALFYVVNSLAVKKTVNREYLKGKIVEII